MDKQLFKDVAPDHREQYIRDNCYKIIDNHHYTRNLTEEEILEAKEDLFQASLMISKEESELKSIRKEYQERLKKLKGEKNELLEMLQFKAKSEKGTAFEFDYQDEGMMSLYDTQGRLISSRPLGPTERQTSIFTINKNGTED